MDQGTTFPDWPAKRDAIRADLAARGVKLDHAGPLYPVPGAVTEPDGLPARVTARAVFLVIAAEVEPRLLVDLAGEPLDQYATAWESGGAPADADPGPEWWDEEPPSCREAVFDPDGAAVRWCGRWGIPTRGATPHPPGGDHEALVRHVIGHDWAATEIGLTLHTWRVDPFRPGAPSPFGRFLWRSWHRRETDLGLAAPLCLPTPWWDPQREDRESATKRVLAELGRAVRIDLGRIEAAALRTAAAPPAKRTGLEHLAWLARYHFRHESFPTIARDANVGRQAVANGVKEAADLVGLPLREPNPPGRPRKAR